MGKKNKKGDLAFRLRHDSEYKFHKNAWRDVTDLIEHHGYTLDELCEIVATDTKQRYELSDNMQMIRALYGHSVQVEMDYQEVVPPATLYHGTAQKNIESILSNGITPHKRLFVHLSEDRETALTVGNRHGKAIILTIDAKRMHEEGVKFFRPQNGLWLTNYIHPCYIEILWESI